MKRIGNGAMFLLWCAVGTLIFGCGSAKKRIGQDESPSKREAIASGNYQVGKNDSLWEIAGRSEIYGDPYLWPLLFQVNRDQIEDPDLLSPHQKLQIKKGFSKQERQRARKLASDTPKYVPHLEPRKVLPLDYF